MFNHGVYCARHLGWDRSVCLASQMRVVSVSRDVAFELISEAIGALENGRLASHLKSTAKPGVPIF